MEKGILWLLLIEQELHIIEDKLFEVGRENLDTIVFKIECEGCPRRECQMDNGLFIDE